MSATNDIVHYNNLIIQVYQQHDLKCLRGQKSEYEVNGRNILSLHSQAIQQFTGKNNFNFNKNIDDIILCSDEIIYFLANVILFEPLINDPIRDKIDLGNGNFIYPNFQNLYAKRYDMFTNVCYEKIYNYWDRIGDLIAACIDTGLHERRIYFATVLSNIPEQFRNNEHFSWLLDYKNNEYGELTKERRNIVHYLGSGTEFSYQLIFSSSDRTEVEYLMEERRRIPITLQSALRNSIEGFMRTLDFLIFAGPLLPEAISERLSQ